MTNGYPDEELKALLGEMVRRGKSARPALAASKTPDELKARLKSELSSLGGQFARLRANLASLDPRPRTDLGIRYISPTLPETFVTRAPLAVQPAARAVRELSKPVNLALLPIGGAKMGLAAAGGTIAGAQTGHAIAGERGELIGSIAGGVGAPFAPATGRAVLRGGVRLAEEMCRANVGNVLLPRAPERVAAAAKRPAIPIVTQPWQMTRSEFDREFWLHGRGYSHPRFGQKTTIGGITKSVDEARGFARVRTDMPGGPVNTGEIALIRNTDIPADFAINIGNKRSYSPVRSVEWKVRQVVPGDVENPHKYLVQRAASEGKPVPSEVLGEYPDLVAAQTAPLPIAPAAQAVAPPPAVPAVAQPPVVAPPTQPPMPPAAPPRVPQSSAELALEREVAAARARLPQSSAQTALEREVAAAR